MPSGYTVDIATGIEFAEFVMRCSRAMGALVSMREEPVSTPIPERFEPGPYHAEALQKAQEELALLKSMTEDQASSAAEADFMAKVATNTKAIERSVSLRAKYTEMLTKVKAWVPPTPDHEGFKAFMLEQIEGSIKFDCSEEYYIKHKPGMFSGSAWLAFSMSKVEADIAYHTKAFAEEVERTESRNEWLRQLRASL